MGNVSNVCCQIDDLEQAKKGQSGQKGTLPRNRYSHDGKASLGRPFIATKQTVSPNDIPVPLLCGMRRISGQIHSLKNNLNYLPI